MILGGSLRFGAVVFASGGMYLVGIVNGKAAAVGDDLGEWMRQLQQIASDAKNCFFVEASRDYDDAHEIREADRMPRRN